MKKLMIPRGLPGSGKSFLSNVLALEAIEIGKTCIICSTDDFFMINGRYIFDINKLNTNHRLNQEKAFYHMECGTDVIIIDNTNVCADEVIPYVDRALHHDYVTFLIDVKTEWAFNVDELLKRNVHGVPLESYKRMLSKWQDVDDMGEIIANKCGCTYDCVTQSLFKEINKNLFFH
jgi:tRNA uridine 5-carbamoylmethylation protein Kti12